MTESMRWTDPLRAAFGSCLPCTSCSNRPASPDLDANEPTSSQPTSAGGRRIFARDELEGLLASYSSDEDGGDTLSLHSNFGGGGQSTSKSSRARRKRKGKKKTNAWGITGRSEPSGGGGGGKVIQIFGWYPFGKPSSTIALHDDDGVGSPIVGHGGALRPRSSSVLSTSAPDAAPLESAIIARLGFAEEQDIMGRGEIFEPAKTVEELDQEERELAEREEREAEATVKRPRVSDLGPTSSSSNAPKTRAEDHAKRIRRAAREQRKRLKEEAKRLAQEEFERRADAAAGGFHDHDDLAGGDFGEFVTYRPDAASTTEDTLSEITSSHSQLTPAITHQEEDDDDEDEGLADYGAEYASHSRSQYQLGTGGSRSDGLERQSAGSDSSTRGIRPPTRLAFVPLPPSTIGSNGTFGSPPIERPRHLRTQSKSSSTTNGRDPKSVKRDSYSVQAVAPAQQFDGVPGGLAEGDGIVHGISSGTGRGHATGDPLQDEEFDGVHF
ncbi:hypothetical protein FRB98_002095 [Tulasnella sp. 332]|nr:hypothetical protein FRB98_002095 [Tulasnella sp. 332]